MTSSADVVYVVDDDDAVRESIAVLLEISGFAVQSFASGKQVLDRAAELGFGCIVTDVRMPGIDGLELLERLRELDIRFPVIVITGHGDVPLAVRAIRAGAADFIEKPFEEEVLLRSVRMALAKARETERPDPLRLDIQERLAKLSVREEQVLQRLVAGQQNKTIARDLDISPRTVEIYRAHVMTKMQASSLSDLVRMTLIVELSR
ncbi:MAG: response regulator FixJ [Caulobacteraceae bacterium]